MKELTSMNRYHQTQGRPKPPVEQRVKVMDTLDKKMESILEREDMSTDERLKLYDKKDTIEEEILESVPKTMKTKAELLVRKMKADPKIAWSVGVTW
jgi:hypothetical protein